jgi:hypothetical protein
MTRRSASTALAFCALLAWDSAAAESRPSVPIPPPPPGKAAPATTPTPPGGAAGPGMTVDPYYYPSSGIGAYDARRQASAPAVLADLLMLRPFGIGMTVVGGALFLATAPFTAIASIAPPHDAVQRSGNALFVGPAAFTFYRPLGEFTYQPSGVYPVRP